MQLCFFEDEKAKNFHPLTLTRPVDDLRIGILTISEKWKRALESTSITRVLRPKLTGVFEKKAINPSRSCIWINSRYLPDDDLLQKIEQLSDGQCLQCDETVIAAKVNGTDSAKWHKNDSTNFKNLFVLETADFSSIKQLWDLYQLNGREIKKDIQYANSAGKQNFSHAVLQNSSDIYIEAGASIEPECVLIAEKGPIYIGKGATVMAGSHIRGPAAICEDSIVKMDAKIYENTTVGPVCKVGGELNSTVFHSYSNKGHEGYVGNSVIGQWCNLGADTNTSNMKNNYSPIRITNWEDQREIETGQQFLGSFIADHTKTAINTQFNTGTICGVSCNIFPTDFPPKFIPSFSWVGSNVIQTYKLDKAFEAMQAMMERRGMSLADENKQMYEQIFNQKR